jgi:uncharacterized protein YbaP (TraB family)
VRAITPWFAAIAALSLAGGRALAQPPMWVAHGAHSTLFMFGSVHLLPLGLDWEPPALAAALATADEVWFELPIDQATDIEAARLAEARGALPPGDRLSALLTADQQARLSRVTRALGLAPEAIERMRPWLAEVTLSLASDEQSGAVASQGVEQQVQDSAPPDTERRALETARQQIGFLADTASADQIASLDETLHEIEERPHAYGQVVAEWMTGDLAGLDADALAPLRLASPAMYTRLITQRNRRWTAAIGRRLRRPGVTVVVVGMGHLLGPGGVPALLRADGVKVDGP